MKKIILIILLSFLGYTASSQQTYVPDDAFENYLENNNMGNGIPNDNYVTTANISGVTMLNLDSQNISDMTGIEDFVSLTVLSCNYNQISSIDISNLTQLESLYIDNNQLSSLDISHNVNLKYLHASSNQITTINVSNNTQLINILLSSNPLTALDVSNLANLDYLSVEFCQLQELDVSANHALRILYCGANQLSSLNIANGNNQNMIYMYATNNPDLTCIQVDDAANTPPPGQDWLKDNTASYSNDCSSAIDDETPSVFRVFPNPAHNYIRLEFSENHEGIIKIYDYTGKLLWQGEARPELQIDISAFQKALYWVEYTYQNRKTFEKLLVK